MLTVYAIPESLYCAKLRILLRAKGLSWTEVPPPGGYGSEEYKRTVASGNLPALVDDGFLIADSEAIAEYLEETHPSPPLLPRGAQARARMRERGRFHDTRLEPAVRRLFPHIRPARRDDAVVSAAAHEIARRLDQFARILNIDGIDQEFFGLGDCGWPVTLMWIDLLALVFGLELPLPPEVAAYRDRLVLVPAVAAELAEYRPRVAAWLAEETA